MSLNREDPLINSQWKMQGSPEDKQVMFRLIVHRLVPSYSLSSSSSSNSTMPQLNEK